jgi:salicylate hydroxylase
VLWINFRGGGNPARGIIEANDPEKISFLPWCDRPPLKSWSQGRVTLLGDAAHAMPTTAGQGANTTFEDAYELAQCLSESSNLKEALTNYENRRIPRTQVIHARSALAGRDSSKEIVTPDPEKAEQERIALEKFQRWLLEYDPNSESRLQPWIETPAEPL